jgi:hypothetical protein
MTMHPSLTHVNERGGDCYLESWQRLNMTWMCRRALVDRFARPGLSRARSTLSPRA